MTNIEYYFFVASGVLTIVFLTDFVSKFYSKFAGGIFVEPTSSSEKFQAALWTWFTYYITMLAFSFTGGSFFYVGMIFSYFNNFDVEAIRKYLESNALAIEIVMKSGVVLGAFIVATARILATSYSDFLVKYLVFQLLMPVAVAITTFPIFNLHFGEDFYAVLTDFFMRARIQDWPFTMAIPLSLITAIGVEIYVNAVRAKWVHRQRSLSIVHGPMESYEVGQHIIRDTESLYQSAIQRTINGLDRYQAEELKSIEWASFHGSKRIASTLRTEMRVLVARTVFLMSPDSIDLLQRYDDIQNLQDDIGTDIRKYIRKHGNYQSAMNHILELLVGKLSTGATQMTAHEVQRLLDTDIEDAAQRMIEKSLRIIATPSAKRSIQRYLKSDSIFRIVPLQNFGNRRFMVLNSSRLVLTTPIPYTLDAERFPYASNVGILIECSPYRVHAYSSHFKDWWFSLPQPPQGAAIVTT